LPGESERSTPRSWKKKNRRGEKAGGELIIKECNLLPGRLRAIEREKRRYRGRRPGYKL